MLRSARLGWSDGRVVGVFRLVLRPRPVSRSCFGRSYPEAYEASGAGFRSLGLHGKCTGRHLAGGGSCSGAAAHRDILPSRSDAGTDQALRNIDLERRPMPVPVPYDATCDDSARDGCQTWWLWGIGSDWSLIVELGAVCYGAGQRITKLIANSEARWRRNLREKHP